MSTTVLHTEEVKLTMKYGKFEECVIVAGSDGNCA